MEFGKGVSIVVPTYNEAANVGPLIDRCRAAMAPEVPSCPLEFVIVDDNSPDGTGRLCQELAKGCPDMRVFIFKFGSQCLDRRLAKHAEGIADNAGHKGALVTQLSCQCWGCRSIADPAQSQGSTGAHIGIGIVQSTLQERRATISPGLCQGPRRPPADLRIFMVQKDH